MSWKLKLTQQVAVDMVIISVCTAFSTDKMNEKICFFKYFYPRSDKTSTRMNEADAERQFLADLEKAKALSMESQALEEFR